MDVVTLTGNLLAEWTFDIVRLNPESTHRAEGMRFHVGGKGINVSRVLGHLGVASVAHGFAGGALAALCTEWLQSRGIVHTFHPLERGVRPGLVVRETGNRGLPETTFLGMDLAVGCPAWGAAMQTIGAEGASWLAICGSIPGWQPSWLEPLKELMQGGNVQVCADTYGPALEDLITLPLELVKINRHELQRLLPEMAGSDSIDLLARVSETSPVRNWIITDGPGPILAAFENGDLYEVVPAEVEEVSATGSGDTFLAAILQQSLAGASPEEMLAYAAACASANAASPDIGKFTLPVSERFRPTIRRIQES
ncbi:MAG: PfkB family carbohydrate kinase [Opitutales bacterium]